MKIKIKVLNETKWQQIEYKALEGKSVLQFLFECQEPAMAALFEEDVPIAFMSNNEEELDKYRGKGLCLMVEHAIMFFGSDLYQPLVGKIFEDSLLVEHSV